MPHQAVKIALELKKHLVDNELLEVCQVLNPPKIGVTHMKMLLVDLKGVNAC